MSKQRYAYYDSEVDIAYFTVRHDPEDSNSHYSHSVEHEWGVIDVPNDGGVSGIEVWQASERLPAWLIGSLPRPPERDT